ncbi:multidrug ABC transporter [Sulfuriferula plumbiphila]|uniref:Multidrug ABC transporter n=1 Tax=Sulfuriferula plumbiphila TaxID=171865 RepID=A0A512L9H8_9PROT|nr:efflux RND transporter permease subunit [Sulfuriferula plumbiphila]BBP05987.1 multidrug ABC transporter [Sulfuriferula plumbiphila]GEP31140.1 multidrug ABC transporter [Sulfuriferula plumbiphila]
MNFTQWMQGHRRSILFLLVLLAVAGVLAAFKLPVTLFPNVDFPRVLVSLDAGDRPADLMMLVVTQPVEEAVRRVPGVRGVRSTTSRGTAEVSVSFDWGIDMGLATSQVNQAITRILPNLPPGTQLATKRMDPTIFPILAYSLTSTTQSQTALYDLARYQLRPLLSSVNGVARIQVMGGAQEEYQVTVDPAQLLAYGLTLTDVAQALSAANVVTAVGRLEDHYKLYLAIADARLKNVRQIGNTVIRSGTSGIVRLDDVAQVSDGVVPQWIKVNADGRPAVLFNIYQQPGSNSVQIARDVHAKLAAYQSQLPPGVKLANWYDQSVLVLDSAASVRDAIMIGTGLAVLVLFAFLRNIKITLIAAIVVPTVLAATVVLLYALGMSFNIMTLGGMAAAVGLIIDDAIVMIEHIVRRLRGATGERHHGRVMAAAMEFMRPLAGSSASTIIIFLPLAFLTGVTGAFFKALSLTMASGLIISFFVTWLAVPLLADHFLTEKDANQKEGGRLTEWMHRRYAALMQRVLARPVLILLLVVPLLGVGFVAFNKVGSGFMPAMDEGGFILDYRAAPGTSLTETDRLLQQVEAIIKANPYVDTYSRRTGTQLGGGITEANQGDFFVRLKAGKRPPIDTVMGDIRSQVEHNVPGLKIEMAQLMEDVIGDLTSVPQPIEIKLFSDNPDELQSAATKVVAAINQVPGVVDTRDGINPAGDALEIRVDRVKAALEGMNPDSITQTLSGYLSGVVTTQMQKGPKLVGVRVWIPQDQRAITPDVGKLLIRAPDGHVFPLRRVAQIVPISGQPQIRRENLKRMVAVTGRISGRSMGSVIADIQKAMATPKLLPKGMYFELGGLYKQQQIAFKGLMAVFVAAIGLVFLLLLFLYESFRMALAILAIPLLAVSAVFIGLWVAGIELNISAMMGMTMIIGIVTEVAIFYFSEYRDLIREMPFPQALIEAGKNRMRPIAMTTFAAILTLLPLAFAIGQGSAMQQPLAVAIIAGLAVQLPLVLLVMPVLYWLLAGKADVSAG